MATKLKGLTLEIGGDTQALENALSGVNKTTKNLQSELREVDKLLKMDPKNTEVIAQKQKLLADSVSNTKDKLDQLKKAAEQAQEKLAKGEISEEQFRALQREVVKTEQDLKKLTTQAKTFGDEFDRKLKNVSKGLKDVGSGIENAGKKMSGVSKVAGGAVAGMVGLAVKSGQAADEINTLAKQTGLSTEQIQKFKYASDIIDVSLETLTGSMSKLTKNMSTARGGTGAAAEAFEALGVKIKDDVTGELRNNQDVFDETIKALADLENETERDARAMEIFGKSAQDLNPLILGGADALKQLGEEAEAAGLILSQEALDSANEFNDSIDKLKATAVGTFGSLGAEIAEMLIPMMELLSEKLGAAMEWIRGLDQDTLKLIMTILAIVAAVSPVLIIIGKLISSVGIIVGALGKLKFIMTGVNMAIGLVGKAFALLAANPIVLIVAGIAILIGILIHAWKTNEDFRNAVIAIWENIKQMFSDSIEAIKGFFNGMITFFKELPGKIMEQLLAVVAKMNEWRDNISEFVKVEIPKIIADIVGYFMGLPGKMLGIGGDLIEGLWEGIKGMTGWIGEKVSGFAGGIVKGVKKVFGVQSPSKVFAGIGGFMAEGLGLGFLSEMKDISKQITNSVPKTFESDVSYAVSNASDFETDRDRKRKAAQLKEKNTVEHKGTIRVEGINEKGQLQDVIEIVIDKLRREVRMA